MDAIEAGRVISALRKRVRSLCIVCSAPMEGIAKKRYCSTSCKLKDWRARKRTDLYRQPVDG